MALPVVAGRPASATPAQSPITDADVQRLKDGIDSASRDVAQLQSRDAALASRLQRDLEDARDEVGDLKGKLRKNEPVAREDYWTLRDRIDREPRV